MTLSGLVWGIACYTPRYTPWWGIAVGYSKTGVRGIAVGYSKTGVRGIAVFAPQARKKTVFDILMTFLRHYTSKFYAF